MTNDEAIYLVERLKTLCADMQRLVDEASQELDRIGQSVIPQTESHITCYGTCTDKCGAYENGDCTLNARKVDTPQTDCDKCIWNVCNYNKVDWDADTPQTETQTETQNSNLSFEKVMEEIQAQVIEFPDTHQKFVFARKIEMDGDSIKIGDWDYKGVKAEEREGE